MFGAETSGLMGGLRLVQAAIGGLGGFTKGALSDMNSGLHSITSGFATMGTGAGGVFSSLRIGAQDVGTGMLKLGAVMALVGGIAAVAIGVTLGVVAVRAAADFQQGMSRLVTGAGDVTDNMKAMGQSILATSAATGVLTGQLLPAMYQIISAGQRGAAAQDTLRVAAMGSVTEQAKIVDVAKALTTAMTDYGTTQYNATQYMNGYTRATQLGKLTLEELSTSMGPILPLAKNIGISFEDVAGAMSTMTNAGIPAERSATSLRFLFQSLEVPTHKATVAMESMGLSSVAVGNELKKSLPGALEMIYKAALKAGPEGSVPFNRAVSDMIGGQRSLQAYLALTGSHFATYSTNARAIADAMNHSKTAVLGWDVAQQNFNVVLSQGKAAVMALAINVGSQLLPLVTRIAGQIIPVIAHFAEWATKTNFLGNAINAVAPVFNAFFGTLAAVLPTVIGAFLQFMAVLGRLIASVAGNKQGMEALILVAKGLALLIAGVLIAGLLTLAIVFGAIALVIVGVINVVKFLIIAWNGLVAAANWVAGAWRAAIAWLGGAWHSLVGFATSAFNGVKNAIVSAVNATVSWITTAFNNVINWLVNAWHSAVNGVVAAFAWLYNHNYYFKALVDTIRAVVSAGIAWLTSAWNTAVSWLGNKWAELKGLAESAWDGVKGVFSAVWGWISGILSSLWASISGWFTGTVIPQMQSHATSAWQGVSNVFSSAWGTYIAGPLGGLANTIAGFFNGLVGQMIQFGRNLIQGLVDGINSMLGAVSGAASNVASTITGILGFHSPPKYGPAVDADTWMPNMVDMLTKGMTGGVPSVAKAATQLVQPIQGNLSAGGTRPAASSSGSTSRPLIIQIGNREYRAFIDNLGNDLVGSSTVRVHFAGGR